MRFPLVGAAVLLVVRAALAQTVVVGGIPSGVAGTFPGAGPQTIVDLAHPANRDGDLTTASVLWSANVPSPASCTAAFKIKILRRGLGTFSVVAERGPFAVQPGYGTVALTPPIAVRAGDLLAVVQLLDTATCGGVGAGAAGPREVVLRYLATDLASGSFASNGLLLSGAALMVRASSDAEVPAAFLPVVGSAAGVNTFFRTSAQAFNPSTQLIKGKYVFHPAGRAGVASDPSMNYVYAGGSATSIPDVLAAMGQSGLGSLDVVPSSGVPPRVIAHIYSDNGSGGTAGFTMDALTADEALRSNISYDLLSPSDLTLFRMNVGLRTLDAGATITVIRGFSGFTRTYPPNYFEQMTLAAFLGEAPVANNLYFVALESGSAFIYTSTTDNRTSDTTIRFLTIGR